MKLIVFCVDIDECPSAPCPANSACVNNIGSYSCDCNLGYRKQGNLCVDVDECTDSSVCPANSTCTNNVGSYTCPCDSGFIQDADSCKERTIVSLAARVTMMLSDTSPLLSFSSSLERSRCVGPALSDTNTCSKYHAQESKLRDVDECTASSVCPANSTCTNNVGSYTCPCDSGFIQDADSCKDVDECTDSSVCPANSTCTNNVGSYTCPCDSGFIQDADSCNGLKRFKRLMFGVNAAPELFQHALGEILQGIIGVTHYIDDIIIHGADKAAHDTSLTQIPNRLQERGATLNKEKGLFGVNKLTFLGYTFGQDGISPEPQRFKPS
ncbi:latent-transforming growth factor beta-binding protein 2 [Elysia marginata]|uniref:Latent-transforming growth factor beta-binding protein 2 n=1 Tax=Elysia marginata TaxID=1093978 RepID=A0AAV4E9R5_9GAST|nr:latent-transforming growth factor beta-binding protein 2 [Elysia marginata]